MARNQQVLFKSVLPLLAQEGVFSMPIKRTAK
jgi:hypothetical protein